MKILTILLLIFIISITSAQIHRATNQNNYQIKYNTNFTLQYYLKKLDYFSAVASNNSSLITLMNHYLYNDQKLFVWFSSVIGTFFVGICGIVPVAILPQLTNNHHKLVFKCLVSFAAGTLLGDVFVHLLPETYTTKVLNDNQQIISNGLWLLFGLVSFLTIEKIFPDDDDDKESEQKKTSRLKLKRKKRNLNKKFEFLHSIKTVGLLNLFANIIDNFTHGIAVAGSFQASFKFGVMTLIATMLHEIPHEIGDFVILLKSGLNYKEAAIAQLITAFSGILGALFALNSTSAERAGDITSWILPFTCGGFLYISLINIIPEILSEKSFKTSLKQILCLIFGIFLIYILNLMFE